ncbi:rhodanese-like domain-containing protein [Saprospiraceae bacterium]|nr:rhodanese-like domain-containing protein [Saprospiraceae bacterium]
MKTKLFSILLFLGIAQLSLAQATADAGIVNPEFKKTVDSYLKFNVPTTTVSILSSLDRPHVILDAREREEYDVSHIPDALYFGYKKPQYDILDGIDKDEIIIIYCSIGYRSEKLGEKLNKKGYKNVLNLYGSIFEWANEGYPLVDSNNQPTDRIHGFNKKWSKWVDNEELEVTY